MKTAQTPDDLRRIDADHAPWYVIPADHKWFRDLAISEIIVATLESMNIQVPEPTVDIEEIRSKYHLAAVEAKRARKSRKRAR